MYFPLLSLSEEKWDFVSNRDEMTLYSGDLKIQISDEEYERNLRGKKYIDLNGYVYEIIGLKRINLKWWEKIIPFKTKAIIDFQKQNETFSIEEVKEFVINKLLEMEKQSDFTEKWIDFIPKAETIEEIIFPKI